MHKPQRRSSYQAKIPNLNLAGIRWNIRSLTTEYTSEKCFSSLFQVLNLLTSIWSSHVNSQLRRWRVVFLESIVRKKGCVTDSYVLLAIYIISIVLKRQNAHGFYFSFQTRVLTIFKTQKFLTEKYHFLAELRNVKSLKYSCLWW